MKRIIIILSMLTGIAYAQCDTVTNLTISNVTYNSGRATFTPPAQAVSTYSWAIFTYPGNVFTGVQGTGPSTVVNFSGLSASTTYKFKIATICVSAGTSVQAGKVFTTLANTIIYTPESHREFPYIRVDSGLSLKADDTLLRRAPSGDPMIKYKSSNNTFYGYYPNCTCWRPLAIDSFGIVALLNDKVDSVTFSGSTLNYWKQGVSYGYVLPFVDNSIRSHESIFARINGSYIFQYIDSTGGLPNTSVGSGYKIAINGTNNVKSIHPKVWLIGDSATTNEVGVSADSAAIVARMKQVAHDSADVITASKSVEKTGRDVHLVGDSATVTGTKGYISVNGIKTWYDVVRTKITDPHEGDILVYKPDSLYWYNIPNTGGGFRQLMCMVGQTHGPQAGDTMFSQLSWKGKWIDLIRSYKHPQLGDSLNYGYLFDSSTGIIRFYPALSDSEALTFRIYTNTPVMDALEIPVPTWVDVDYPTVVDITSTAHVWTPTVTGTFNQKGLSATTLTADGSYAFQLFASDGTNGIIGFNSSNANEDYTHYEAGFYLDGSNHVKPVDGGSIGSTVATLSVGDYARINRTGSVFKIQTSTDKVTWVDVYTYSYSGSATMYLGINLYDDGSTIAKIYYPQILQ